MQQHLQTVRGHVTIETIPSEDEAALAERKMIAVVAAASEHAAALANSTWICPMVAAP